MYSWTFRSFAVGRALVVLASALCAGAPACPRSRAAAPKSATRTKQFAILRVTEAVLAVFFICSPLRKSDTLRARSCAISADVKKPGFRPDTVKTDSREPGEEGNTGRLGRAWGANEEKSKLR